MRIRRCGVAKELAFCWGGGVVWGNGGEESGRRDPPGIQPCEKMYVREQRRLLLRSGFVGEFSHGRMEEAPGCAA